MASEETSPAPSPDKQKGISRKKKSASQTEVLERAYALDKYPSEASRVLLSRELGLSEKQLQIWFTHRRYKDRRDGIEDDKLAFYAHRNKADLPSEEAPRSVKKGAIDLNSREGDEDNSEGDGYPARVLAEERDDEVLMDEHRNGTNSRNGANFHNGGGYGDVDRLKPAPRRRSAPRAPRDPSKPPRKPGPKPKVTAMAAAEQAAILAVESQLCGPLRDDGPPLGFEFDPLPPGAFQELTSTEGPYTAGGSREGGSENYSERAALESRWGQDLALSEKKKRKVGDRDTIPRPRDWRISQAE